MAGAWWRQQMETFSELLALCRGIYRSPMGSPHEGHWSDVSVKSILNNLSVTYFRCLDLEHICSHVISKQCTKLAMINLHTSKFRPCLFCIRFACTAGFFGGFVTKMCRFFIIEIQTKNLNLILSFYMGVICGRIENLCSTDVLIIPSSRFSCCIFDF